MKIGDCSLCGEEIFSQDEYEMYRQVVGWERTKRRKQGGTNALRIRRETGALAHGRCVEEGARKQKAGLPAGQGGLF